MEDGHIEKGTAPVCTEVRVRSGGTRGDTVLFLLVLLAVLSAYVVKSVLDRLDLPGGVVAVALLALLAFWLLRVRMVSYRYTVRDGELVVEKLVGKRSSVAAVVKLADCTVCKSDAAGAKRRVALTPNDKKDALVLLCESKEERMLYYIDPSEKFRALIGEMTENG